MATFDKGTASPALRAIMVGIGADHWEPTADGGVRLHVPGEPSAYYSAEQIVAAYRQNKVRGG